jgi:hypothetical protein
MVFPVRYLVIRVSRKQNLYNDGLINKKKKKNRENTQIINIKHSLDVI